MFDDSFQGSAVERQSLVVARSASRDRSDWTDGESALMGYDHYD
jgi:hypothetical protein